MWSAFFLYFLIFSCFSEARKAVKRTPEVKFSYTELALILLLDFIGTVRVTFHAVSAKYFSLPARNISCWKAMIGGQQVTGIGGVPEKIAQGASCSHVGVSPPNSPCQDCDTLWLRLCDGSALALLLRGRQWYG